MNVNELMERLTLLREGDVITAEAARVTREAFEHLVKLTGNAELAESEMLFTHLASALTRLERREVIAGPPAEILAEIMDNPYKMDAEKEIKFIEKRAGATLPEEEHQYLHLHYAMVLPQNFSETTAEEAL